MFRFCVSLLLLLSISSCQLWQRPPAAQGWVPFASGYYQLLDSWRGQPQQLLQQAVWHDSKTEQQFLISVLLTEQQMVLVGLSGLGQELWRLAYQPGHQLSHSGIAPFDQPQVARRLLAEMQLALLDQASLSTRLQGLQLQQNAAGERQLVTASGELQLTIRGAATLAVGHSTEIITDDYRLTISTLQQDFLP